MKHLKFKIFIAIIFLFVAVGFYGNNLEVFALETAIDSLHLRTKIYNSNNADYFNGCECRLF